MQPGSKNDKQSSLCDKNTPNEAEKEKFKIQDSKFKIQDCHPERAERRGIYRCPLAAVCGNKEDSSAVAFGMTKRNSRFKIQDWRRVLVGGIGGLGIMGVVAKFTKLLFNPASQA